MNPALLALIAAAIESITEIAKQVSAGSMSEEQAMQLLQNSAVAYTQARAAWDAAKEQAGSI